MGLISRRVHLAVDLFFGLSGFCDAEAYNRRLENGLSASMFMKIRIIRLYPMYFLEFSIGADRTGGRIDVRKNFSPIGFASVACEFDGRNVHDSVFAGPICFPFKHTGLVSVCGVASKFYLRFGI